MDVASLMSKQEKNAALRNFYQDKKSLSHVNSRKVINVKGNHESRNKGQALGEWSAQFIITSFLICF